MNENEEKEFEDCIPITKKEAVDELSFIFEKVKWERYAKAEIFRKEDVLETLFYTEDQNYRLFSQTLLLRIKEYASVDFCFRMLAFRRILAPYAPINQLFIFEQLFLLKNNNLLEKSLFISSLCRDRWICLFFNWNNLNEMFFRFL